MYMPLQQAQQAAAEQGSQHCPRPWGSRRSMLLHFASGVTWVVGLVEAPHPMSPGVVAVSTQVVAGQPPTGDALVAATLDGEQAAGIAADAAGMGTSYDASC